MDFRRRSAEDILRVFKTVNEESLQEGWRQESSVWGNMAVQLGKNNAKNRRQLYDFWRRNTAKVKSIILNQKKANTCSDHSCTSSFEQVDTDIHFRKNKKKLSDQCEGMSFVKQLNFIDTSREKIEPSNDSTIKWEVDSNNDQWLSDNQEVESDVIEDAIKQENTKWDV